MALMRYLVRDRNGAYYVRRLIPPDLRPHLPGRFQGMANWKTPLRTGEPAEAKRRYGPVLIACNRNFELAAMRRAASERDELTDAEIAAGATWYRDSQPCRGRPAASSQAPRRWPEASEVYREGVEERIGMAAE